MLNMQATRILTGNSIHSVISVPSVAKNALATV